MDKRYQVFLGSTFRDLQEERQEIMQALLELDFIPAGMELFPAANEDQWTLIKKVIDDCDYYIVVIGGRYGSLGPEGISYTEMEYRYALETKKPVVAFLHKDPGTLPANRTEESSEGKEKFEEFRMLAKERMVKYWSTPPDLRSVVSRSLITLIKKHSAIGWVRANQVPDESTVEDILRLRKRVDELEVEDQLRAARSQAPEGSEALAQGSDQFNIHFKFVGKAPLSYAVMTWSGNFLASWNTVFSAISPLLMGESLEHTLKSGLNAFIQDQRADDLSERKDLQGQSLSNFMIEQEDFQTIKVQLSALGLIAKSNRLRSVKDSYTYWTLTPYGEETMMRLRAIRRA